MRRIEAILDTVEPVWPETPDPWPVVERRLAPPRFRWLAATAAVVLAAVVLGGALLGALPVVADGLGIGAVDVEMGPVLATAAELDLGEQVIDPAGVPVPATLGPPDGIFRGDGVTWLVYLSDGDLPEVLDTGIGALIARIDGQGLLEKVVDPTATDRRDVRVGELPAVWFEGGPHELLVLSGADVEERRGRPAANTLIWVDGGVTFRIEVALPLQEALRIAESMEP